MIKADCPTQVGVESLGTMAEEEDPTCPEEVPWFEEEELLKLPEERGVPEAAPLEILNCLNHLPQVFEDLQNSQKEEKNNPPLGF